MNGENNPSFPVDPVCVSVHAYACECVCVCMCMHQLSVCSVYQRSVRAPLYAGMLKQG